MKSMPLLILFILFSLTTSAMVRAQDLFDVERSKRATVFITKIAARPKSLVVLGPAPSLVKMA